MQYDYTHFVLNKQQALYELMQNNLDVLSDKTATNRVLIRGRTRARERESLRNNIAAVALWVVTSTPRNPPAVQWLRVLLLKYGNLPRKGKTLPASDCGESQYPAHATRGYFRKKRYPGLRPV